MTMYKLTYIDLARNENKKEVFPDRESCIIRKDFLCQYPKGMFSKPDMTEINDGFHIRYSKLGTETVPDQWMYGEVISTREVGKWYDGFENWVETEKEVKNFIKEKKSISNKTYGRFIVEHIVNGEVVATFKY